MPLKNISGGLSIITTKVVYYVMLTKDWYFDDKLGAGFEKLSRRDSEVRLESAWALWTFVHIG